MTAPGVFTQYSTVAPFIGAKPGWVDTVEQERIASYQIYEEMYWSSESGFQTVMRGDNDSPIMMPTGRTLVNTLNRYTAPDFGFRVDGDDPNAVSVAQLAFAKLFERETFFSKFKSNKLMGGIRGDWLWHVVGDMDKPLGKRLSIYAVDPASYFPIPHPDDPNRIIGCHLAEVTTFEGQPAVNRLTYRKVLDEVTGETIGITREHGVYENEKWWTDAAKVKATILPLEQLDPLITFLPVWHIKNFDANAPYGSSYLRGLEALLLGINQTMSDEDLTLALEGLGVYATDGDAPVDENGNEVDWIMGPARVLTKANGLRRITGATNISAYGDHYNRLRDAAHESVGASDVAVGAAAQGVESGIALAIRLGPILAYTGDADAIILDVHRQMFYDLQFLFQVYEELPMLTTDETGANVPLVTVIPTIGTKVPTNLTEVVTHVQTLRNTVPPVISLRTSHALLRKAGMDIPEDELAVLAQEATGVVLDPLGEPVEGEETAEEERIDDELDGEFV